MNNSGPYAHGDQSRGKSTTVSVTCWPRLARTHCLSTAPAPNCRWSGSRNWMVACADFPYVQLSPALSVPGGLARSRSRYGCAHSANPCPSEWRERRGCCMTGYTVHTTDSSHHKTHWQEVNSEKVRRSLWQCTSYEHRWTTGRWTCVIFVKWNEA